MGIDRSRARRPTRHARAEGAAQGTEAQYRALLDAIPDMIFRLSREGRFLDYVPAKGQQPLIPPSEFLGRTSCEVLPADLARRAMDSIERALRTGETQVSEFRVPVPLPDGKPRDYEARIAASAKDEVVAIVRDITRSRRTRDALREGEAKYRQVFEHVHDVFYRADTNGAFTEISPSVEWWGHDVEQLIGAQVSDVYEDPQGRSAFLSLLLEQGRVIDYEVRLKTGDGRLIDASVSSHLLRDRDGVVVGIEGIARDITERKRAEQAIRESEQRLRTLVTNAPVILFAIDREGMFTVEEGKGLSGLGLTPGQNVGRSVFDVYRDVPEVIDAARRALAGESFTATVELAGGLVFEAHYAPLRDQHGQVSGGIAVGTDITERKRAEERLRIQRDLALALSAITDLQDTLRLCVQAAIRVSDVDSGCVYLGDRSSGALYLASHEGLGDKFVERILRFEAGSDHMRTVMTGKPLYTRYEKLRVRMDEARRREGLRAFAAVPVKHGDEVIACLCIMSHSLDNIPPASRAALEAIAARIGSTIVRSGADEALRESEERFRRLAEDSIDGILLIESSEVRFANAALVRMFGYESDEEVLGRPFTDFVSEGYRELMVERGRARDEGLDVPDLYEFRPLRKDGSEFEAEISVSTITYRGGWARLGVIRDVTERKRAEEALRESETKFRTLTETAAASIFIYRGAKPLYVNAAMETLTGYAREEILGGELWQFVHPDLQSLLRERSRARQQGEDAPSRYEFKIVRRSGEERWVDFTAGIIEFEGQPAVIGTAYDITERKQAEQALRESEDRFRRLSEATLEGVVIYDGERVLDANSRAAAMLGYELSELFGTDAWRFLAPDCHDLVRQQVLAGYGESYEVRGLRKDGTTFPMEVCGKTASYEGRQVRVGVMRDISERKRAEEAAQAAREELESRVEHAMRRGNPYGLTFRELTVLYLMAAGRADKEIAFQLGISPRTASKHVENILQRMGVASRTGASVRALREGLVGDAD